MDNHRFDDLARRGLLKGVVGGLLGGMAGHGAAEARAARLPDGAACTRATRCASLTCADGVCCDTACTGQCEVCDLQGAVGTCTPVPAGTQQWGTRPACTGTDVCQASCDGVTRTHCTEYPDLDVTCADPVCEYGWQITYGCGGDGTCHPTTTSCGLYDCNSAGTGCLSICQDHDDCIGPAHCVDGACQGDLPPGQPCATPVQCQSGLCVDGVCCASTCDDPCQACNVPGNLGFCTDVADGMTCDDGDACTTDDTCHNGACQGDLITCTMPGVCQTDPGTCDPQTGACVYPDAPRDTPCGDNRVCRDGACCGFANTECTANDQCCAGLCRDGFCAVVT